MAFEKTEKDYRKDYQKYLKSLSGLAYKPKSYYEWRFGDYND